MEEAALEGEVNVCGTGPASVVNWNWPTRLATSLEMFSRFRPDVVIQALLRLEIASCPTTLSLCDVSITPPSLSSFDFSNVCVQCLCPVVYDSIVICPSSIGTSTLHNVDHQIALVTSAS